MRMGLVAGAKLPVWEPKPGEAAPEPNPSLAYICSLLPRESCSALLQCSALILKAIGRDALKAVEQQCRRVKTVGSCASVQLTHHAVHGLYEEGADEMACSSTCPLPTLGTHGDTGGGSISQLLNIIVLLLQVHHQFTIIRVGDVKSLLLRICDYFQFNTNTTKYLQFEI